jgi:glycosyltransferase involved in cell wall biosynthesis
VIYNQCVNDTAMRQPWLSVIIPVHNGERWLDVALQSVVDQNELGIEVIVIDSSATNRCINIAAEFSNRLNVQVHSRPDLLPWTVKTNFGAARAKADWICMLHQDDFWLPQRCAALREWLLQHSSAVMHLHPSYFVDSSGRKLGLWRCPLPSPAAPVPMDLLLERLLVQNFIAIPSPTIRRDAFLTVNGLDEELWHTADWDLYLKVTAIGDVFYHHDPLACFRIHTESLTVSGSRNIDDFRSQHEKVPRRYVSRLPLRSRERTLRLAATSTSVNIALAEANNGNATALLRAFVAIMSLPPRLMIQYFRYSRILERVRSRLLIYLSAE